MISERDTWAAANILIKKYGDDAELRAAERADEMLDQGDIDGQRIWLRILEAVKRLTDTEPPKNTRLHSTERSITYPQRPWRDSGIIRTRETSGNWRTSWSGR